MERNVWSSWLFGTLYGVILLTNLFVWYCYEYCVNGLPPFLFLLLNDGLIIYDNVSQVRYCESRYTILIQEYRFSSITNVICKNL